jgi:hypothetical protein
MTTGGAGVGLATGEGLGLGVGCGVGDGLEDGDGLGLGEGIGLGLGVGLGDGDGFGVGDGDGLGWTTTTRAGGDCTPRAVAVISAFPGAMALTRPLASTDKSEFAVECQLNSTPLSSRLVSSNACAANCTCSPTMSV